MMFHFGNSWAKLDRAYEHLSMLNAKVALWRTESAAKGQPMAIRYEVDRDTGRYDLFIDAIPETPNLEWGLIIGDFVHNLRTSLDNLAWSLADLHHPDRGDDPSTQFPVAKGPGEDRHGFRGSRVQNQVAHIHPGHIAIIEEAQPYDGDEFNPSHPLWMLHRLDIADKHKAIHIALLAIDLESFRGQPLRVIGGTIRDQTIYETPLEPGTKFMDATVIPAVPGVEPQVYMDYYLTPTVAIPDAGMLKYVLPNLYAFVHSIVFRFQEIVGHAGSHLVDPPAGPG